MSGPMRWERRNRREALDQHRLSTWSHAPAIATGATPFGARGAQMSETAQKQLAVNERRAAIARAAMQRRAEAQRVERVADAMARKVEQREGEPRLDDDSLETLLPRRSSL